jgi:hypothetical protein
VSGVLETDLDAWLFEPDDLATEAVDVAVLPWHSQRGDLDYLMLPHEKLLTESMIKSFRVGLGASLFIPGLFVSHQGTKRNVPIVRTGTIAAMPEEPIETEAMGKMPAYLVESRSVGGLSGSPVLVRTGDCRLSPKGGKILPPRTEFILGLVHGHWDAKLTAEDAVVDIVRKETRVNVGIAVVVPSQKILDVSNCSGTRGGAGGWAVQGPAEIAAGIHGSPTQRRCRASNRLTPFLAAVER